ncbi:type II toxin-antitoxin system mRNA interferase toxin, RelE/StbE family [Candidatus Shapirobacteria bacterium CG_4_8_14_3_um_filter_35_11]|uniref:Type II toxin-antitoxin system mRNA interferase toxin, RelE/StbE family n=5 Tax=Bacteria candidate phyla TaxID=1783234 RepID=A0A1J5HXZ0_9BACT|nr:MAG: hypothetical protein AUK05_03230 [Candidatus Shapirobacteria bacterium CG2_30_35_20]PIV07764.1 MAG: type II toxin-antitoxin system mRNA interferase toxin, RelE/StbE family [Candidatus Shapirobacteria bacterium CG03_land_8_20_14_0_80_35_14]PIW32605.1 MAG: type II toxin-antitoxin system mRNA interferase toxin, RelE/StbE family [bacterium (Candidatus Ratteibacteria) CG15_BIG_FIL_POST_REV_8_21_14_020_41_12]PJA51381.1 MAG: type II toxin-antitoxin system mRNA interferase toxin, RelE/StbE famil
MTIDIEHSPQFDKHFKKRISENDKLTKQFVQRLNYFIDNPKHPLLKDHLLTRNKTGLRSFSINGDLRVIYKIINENKVLFYDIGSHNQVY